MYNVLDPGYEHLNRGTGKESRLMGQYNGLRLQSLFNCIWDSKVQTLNQLGGYECCDLQGEVWTRDRYIEVTSVPLWEKSLLVESS